MPAAINLQPVWWHRQLVSGVMRQRHKNSWIIVVGRSQFEYVLCHCYRNILPFFSQEWISNFPHRVNTNISIAYPDKMIILTKSHYLSLFYTLLLKRNVYKCGNVNWLMSPCVCHLTDPKQSMVFEAPSSLNVKENETAHVWCKVDMGSPLPSLSWLLNGKLIQKCRPFRKQVIDCAAPSDKCHVYLDGGIFKLDVSGSSFPADAGTYSCVVDNQFGATDNATVTVNVLGKRHWYWAECIIRFVCLCQPVSFQTKGIDRPREGIQSP